MRERIVSFWAFIIKHWNIIVAFIASTGFIISSLLPSRGAYSESFIVLGMAGVLFTLVEIKVMLAKTVTTTRFNDMRAARPDIIEAIKKEISRNHKSAYEIKIVGGRIRTISDMLRDVFHKIEAGEITARNVTFSIYCLCPDFINSWSSTKILDDTFQKRMERQASLVQSYTDELITFNSVPAFISNNVKVKVNHYKAFPSIYAFIIGGSCLFWGDFTWNPEKNDFEGPENPCYRLDKRSENFEDRHQLIENRIKFLDICHGVRYSNKQ